MKKWVKDAVLTNVPVLCALFHDKQWSVRFCIMGMTFSMLSGGALLMSLNIASRDLQNDSLVEGYFKDLGNIFFVMTVLTVGYSVSIDIIG